MTAASAFVDDFTADSVVDSSLWTSIGTVSFSGGLVCDRASSGELDSVNTYDLTGSAFTWKVAAGNYYMYVSVGGDTYSFYDSNEGVLASATLQSSGFDDDASAVATSDPWFCLREDAGIIYLETSPDGVTWTERAKAVGRNDVTAAQAGLAVNGTTSGLPDAKFLRMGGGTPPTGPGSGLSLAKVRTIVDTFSGDSVVDTSLWNVANAGIGHDPTFDASGIHLWSDVFTNFVFLNSIVRYDLTDSALVVNVASGSYSFSVINDSNTIQVADSVAGATLADVVLSVYATWSGSDLYGIACADPWLCIRMDSGDILVDTSADGTTWTNRVSLTPDPAFNGKAVRVSIAGTATSGHTPTTAVIASVGLGTPPVGGAPLEIHRLTEYWDAGAHAFAPLLPGDALDNPIVITGSGTDAKSLAGYPARALSEPAYQAGDDSAHRVWYSYTPTSPCTVTFGTDNTSYDTVVEVYVGPDISHLTLYDWNDNDGANVNSSIECVLGAGQTYWIRAHQRNAVDAAQVFNFTWTAVARVASMTISMRDGTTIDSCPATARVDVLNGDANATVTFYVDADGVTAIGTGVLNAYGVANGLPVLLLAYGAGAHTLYVDETTGGTQTGSIDFTVTNDPSAIPTLPPPDVFPHPLVSTKWRIIDPAPGGETYHFKFNPMSMTTPASPRVFTIDSSTAPGSQGQAITFEGARKATQWSFSGIVQQLADLEALARFLDLNHRVVVVDHESHAYVVTVEGLDAKPIRDKDYPKAQQYTANCLIYDTYDL